jgi:hypothetical protein
MKKMLLFIVFVSLFFPVHSFASFIPPGSGSLPGTVTSGDTVTIDDGTTLPGDTTLPGKEYNVSQPVVKFPDLLLLLSLCVFVAFIPYLVRRFLVFVPSLMRSVALRGGSKIFSGFSILFKEKDTK